MQWSSRNAAYSLPIHICSGCFAVNILAADQEEATRRFATAYVDRFAGLELEDGLAEMLLIGGAPARIECALETTLPGGDHTILVGRVLRSRTFLRPPLLRLRGGYLPIAQSPAAPGGQA